MGKNGYQFLLFAIAFALRLPFLFYGYGVEEDSWGHVLNAAIMTETGVYEISRLPGHPLFEALLLILYKVHSPFLYNLPAAIAGAYSVSVFYRIAQSQHIKLAFWWALAFSMVPVVFISSTYTIDYSIALLFILLAFEATLQQNEEKAGLWLAIAVAVRLTSLGMLLPLGYLFFRDKRSEKSLALRLRRVVKLFFVTVFLSLIFYIPPINQYGSAFFNFHKPPYPDVVEAFYKMSIGVWGVLGMIAVAIMLVALLKKGVLKVSNASFTMLLLTFFVYGFAYARMPEKAAFWLPVIPFFLLFAARNVSIKTSYFVIPFLVLSPFFFGINKTDKFTGASHSAFALTFGSSNGSLFIDPLQGPIFNDLSKRQNKLAATARIESQLIKQRQPTLVIAGWWFAMLEMDRRDGIWRNQNIQLVYYASPQELQTWQQQGYQLRYLPEQETVNDKKYLTNFTVKNATLFPIE